MEVSSQINNELKSLDEIFGQGKRVFRIPDYQRGYSWEEQQRTDLLTDIEYLIKSGYQYRHYTGTIVASLNEKETSERDGQYEIFDIVDGQQRLTSLILLLSVICRLVKKSTEKSKFEHTEIFSAFIQGGPEGNTVHKLNLGKDQDKIFKSLVEEGTATEASTTSKSDQNLKDAVIQYQDWLNSQDIDDVLRCVRENLGFLFYAPENNKEIGIMFEVINNRGKALSELEKIKNYLIYYADKNDKRDIRIHVNYSWPEILSNLNKIEYTSNENEDRYLRNCWIVFMDTHKSRSHNVYDNLKLEWPPDSENTKKIIEFIKFLEYAADFYAKYLKREGVTDTHEKYWLERISCHPAAASITPLILAVFGRVKDQNDRNELFELLEKLNFRFYGTGIAGRSDSGQGDLFWYANKFFNYFGKEEDGKEIGVPWLKEELTKFIDQRANDKSFIEYLTLDLDEAGDYYSWVGLKFFLASYEEHLREKINESIDLQRIMASRNPDAPNDFYHKEHIWAVKDLRIEDKENSDVNKRRLGNFLLLKESLNIKVSNKPPEEKVELYFDDWKNAPNTLMIRELKELFDKAIELEEESKNWKRKSKNYWLKVYKRFLDGREEKMVNFALKRWKVSGLNSSISKVKLDSLGSHNEIWSKSGE